ANVDHADAFVPAAFVDRHHVSAGEREDRVDACRGDGLRGQPATLERLRHGAESQNARSRSLNGAPSCCGLCAAPWKTADSAPSRCSSRSQTKPNARPARSRAAGGASSHAPRTPSFGKWAEVRSSNGTVASQGGRWDHDDFVPASAIGFSRSLPEPKPNAWRNRAR